MMVLLAVHLSSPELRDAASGERLTEGLVVAGSERSTFSPIRKAAALSGGIGMSAFDPLRTFDGAGIMAQW
jgi:hypothetical protein